MAGGTVAPGHCLVQLWEECSVYDKGGVVTQCGIRCVEPLIAQCNLSPRHTRPFKHQLDFLHTHNSRTVHSHVVIELTD